MLGFNLNFQINMTTTNHLPLELSWSWSWKFQHQHQHHSQKEHLFEKLLTPSDVGKLNRLVIPKQHAERHFPLDGESGLILTFEDEAAGKVWRFRYSYWSSSQSYVLTKGWSRFVKENMLDAGDFVMFERCNTNVGRLYIGWKRRDADINRPPILRPPPQHFMDCLPVQQRYHVQQDNRCTGDEQMRVAETVETPSLSLTNSRTLRLFGVNLECRLDRPASPEPAAFYSRMDPIELQLLPCSGYSNS